MSSTRSTGVRPTPPKSRTPRSAAWSPGSRSSTTDRFSHYFDADQLAEFNRVDPGLLQRSRHDGRRRDQQEGTPDRFRLQAVTGRPSGFRAGDVIVTVDGKSINGKSTDLVVADIKGPEGPKSRSASGRTARAHGEFTLTREEIRVPITAGLVREVDGRRLGYVRLTTFSDGASVALRRAVDKAPENGAEGIVLDLAPTAAACCRRPCSPRAIFIPEGDVVVKTSPAPSGRNLPRGR